LRGFAQKGGAIIWGKAERSSYKKNGESLPSKTTERDKLF